MYIDFNLACVISDKVIGLPLFSIESFSFKVKPSKVWILGKSLHQYIKFERFIYGPLKTIFDKSVIQRLYRQLSYVYILYFEYFFGKYSEYS